jgi:hypothetical protein
MDQAFRLVLQEHNLQITDDAMYHLASIIYIDNKKINDVMTLICIHCNGNIVNITNHILKTIHNIIDDIFPQHLRDEAHKVADQILFERQIDFIDFAGLHPALVGVLVRDILLTANDIAISKGENIIDIDDIDQAIQSTSLPSSMGSSRGSSMGSSRGSSMGSSRGSSMGSSMGSTRGSSLRPPTGSSSRSSMGSTIPSTIGSSMGSIASSLGSSQKDKRVRELGRPVFAPEVGKLTAIDPVRLSIQSSAIQTKRSPYNVVELKHFLNERGLSTKGSKDTLVARLQEYLANPDHDIL